MTMTQADWQDLAAAEAEGGGAYLTEMANQGQDGVSSIPGDPNSPATTSGLQNTAAKNQPLSQTIAQAWAAYQANPNLYNQAVSNDPQYAWMMSNPELAPILIASASGAIDGSQMQAALQGTNWWKTNGQAIRQFQALQATDPATAQQQVAIQRNTIIAEANSLGVQLSDQDITNLATMATELSWDSNTIQQAVAQAFKPATNINTGGTAGNFYDQAHQMMGQYAVPMSDNDIKWWTQQAVLGKADISGFENYLRNQAKTMYSFMGDALDKGITPQQWFAPYTSAASQLLGVSPDSIQWSDPKWLGAVTTRGADGSVTPVNLTQFQDTLRSNAAFGWSKTQDAVSTAYSTAKQIAQTFGKVA